MAAPAISYLETYVVRGSLNRIFYRKYVERDGVIHEQCIKKTKTKQ